MKRRATSRVSSTCATWSWPYRHKIRLVHQNVRRLQQRISQKPIGAQVFSAQVLLLLLIRRHALQPAQRRNHAQQQMQLRMLRHMALHKQRADLRIEPRAQPVQRHLQRILRHIARIGIVGSQRMVVGDEEVALVLLL